MTCNSCQPTADSEPSVQTTNSLSASGLAMFCMIFTSAPAIAPTIMPTISRLTLSLTLPATLITSSSTSVEPMIADIAIVPAPALTIPNSDVHITTNATPRLAPELTPKIYGPASGLRKSVCIRMPLILSALPARIAVKALGRRRLTRIW